MRSKKTFIVGSVIVLLVSAIATYVTFFSSERSGLQFDLEMLTASSQKEETIVPEDMRSLRTLYMTINKVQKNYIDASRIDSRKMFVAAMLAMQGLVSELLVREEGDGLIYRRGQVERRLSLTEVSTPWILLQRMKEVFSFLERGEDDDEIDFMELEYAAINAMLHTLDPHSAILPPDVYRDMKDKTRGKFGGLGIVISIRDGVLTIISPIDGTPADLVGLEARDQIVKIGDVSTVNMALNDAVNLLRGDPGTTVVVHIMRKGWDASKPFEIVRAIVKVESVESEILDGNIGYVRIKDFQGNTAKDLDSHLVEMEKKQIRGLVLDLRRNPGGLLEAAVRVSDRFLQSGVIVTTAGQGPAQRDVRRAADGGNEPTYPIVVLVDSGSASASEIVAGALKNHDRALLVGERTFGKGSVQVLYDFMDGSALKMTTAQYLTPGDVSIQSVGVVPHVELQPMRADEEMLDLYAEDRYREADLSHHFEGQVRQTRDDRIVASLSYLWTPKKRHGAEAKEGDGDTGDDDTIPLDPKAKFEPDFQIELARDLALKMTESSNIEVRPDGLLPVLERKRVQEQKRLVDALDKLGIDWKSVSDDSLVKITTNVRLDSDLPVVAGEKRKLFVSLTNEGSGAVGRVLGMTRCDFRPLMERELAFGRILPGETVERELEFKVPKDTFSRTDDVRISFVSQGDANIDPVALRLHVESLPRPRFAYNFQVVDVEGGNGDGELQNGERIKFVVDVENVGEGTSLDTHVMLKGRSGAKLFMVEGRAALKELAVGERKRVVFTFELHEKFEEADARVELTIADVDLRIYAVEKIVLPLRSALLVRKDESTLSASSGVSVYDAPRGDARIIGGVLPNSTVKVDGRTDEYYRIRLDEDRYGWVAAAGVTVGGDGDEQAPKLIVNAPPRLNLEEFPTVVSSPTITLRGAAVDESRVRDVYVFVGDEKVFYSPNLNTGNEEKKLSFNAVLPLEYGMNYVVVVAEETGDLDTRKVLTVRRDKEDGMPYIQSRALDQDPEPLGVLPLNLDRAASE